MKVRYSPDPKTYILGNYWRSISVNSPVILSDLEKAVVGYTAYGIAEKGSEVLMQTTTYERLLRLVFEFARIHQPSIIRNSLDKSLEQLDRVANLDGLRSKKLKVRVLKAKYQRTKNEYTRRTPKEAKVGNNGYASNGDNYLQHPGKDVNKMAYEEFALHGFASVLPSHKTPFQKYCQGLIEALVKKQVLYKGKKVGKGFIRVRSGLIKRRDLHHLSNILPQHLNTT